MDSSRDLVASEQNPIQTSSGTKGGSLAHVIGKFRHCWIQRLQVAPSLPPCSGFSLSVPHCLSTLASPLFSHLPWGKTGFQLSLSQRKMAEKEEPNPYIRVQDRGPAGVPGSPLAQPLGPGVYHWSGVGHMPTPVTREAGPVTRRG